MDSESSKKLTSIVTGLAPELSAVAPRSEDPVTPRVEFGNLYRRTSQLAPPDIEAYHLHDRHVQDELVSYEGDHEGYNSTMQLAFSEGMDKDLLVSHSPRYRKVEVLMLSWEKEADDLEVSHECDQLQEIFEKLYNFGVTRSEIKKSANKKAQVLMNQIVANWVAEHDEPKTLLIVYFAGHGKPGDQTGDLVMRGSSALIDLRGYLNDVVWNLTEQFLQCAQSDILQVFDCCYSGTLGMRGNSPRFFETLAATADVTPRPGEDSFTTALVWALKALASDGPFTTLNLANKIRKAPKFKAKPNRPVLTNRGGSAENARIVLRPLEVSQTPTQSANAKPEDFRDNEIIQHGDVLSLKVVFGTRPSEDNIRDLGEGLTAIVYDKKLHVNRLIWGGIQTRDDHTAHRVVQHWKDKVFQRRKFPALLRARSIKPTPSTPSARNEFEERLEDSVHEIHDELRRKEEFESEARSRRQSARDSHSTGER